MSINRSGFYQTNVGLEIDKDSAAQLVYTFKWDDWLESADTVSTATYTVAARRNDPTPMTVVSSGVTADGLQTYVELSGGQVAKTYIVSVNITTTNGLIDARQFRVNVKNRSA